MGKNFNQPIIWRVTYYYMGDFKVQYKKKDVPWYLKPFNNGEIFIDILDHH